MATLADIYQKLVLDSSKYDSGLDDAANKAETTGQKIDKSLSGVGSGMVASLKAAAEELARLSAASVDFAVKVGSGFVKAAEGIAVTTVAIGGITKAIAAFGGESAAAGAQAGGAFEALRNTIRGAELSISTFRYGLLASETALAGLGIGLAVVAERTISAAVETEKLIEAQALLAARSKESFTSISGLAEAERQLGLAAGTFGEVLGLKNIEEAIPKFRELAAAKAQLAGLEDPLERAALAVKLFGDDAEKVLPLLERDLKSATESAYDFAIALDKPTRESLFRIRTEFDSFLGLFKSGWESIALESKNVWREIETGAIKSLVAVEQGVHGLVAQMKADFGAAGVQLEGILVNLPKLLPSGGAGGFEPGMGFAGPATSQPDTRSALEIASANAELNKLSVGMSKLNAQSLAGLVSQFKDLKTAEQIAAEAAAALAKAMAEMKAAFAALGVIDVASEIKTLNDAWNTLASSGKATDVVLEAFNRRMQELSDRIPGVTQAYHNLGLINDTLAKSWADSTNALSETGLALYNLQKGAAATAAEIKKWQDGTLATLPSDITDVTKNVDLLTYSMERLGQVFRTDVEASADASERALHALKGTIFETADLMKGIGLSATLNLRMESDRLGTAYERIVELQREGKATTLDVAGAYDKWTEAELRTVGVTRTLSTEQQQAAREIRSAINSISDGLARSIVHWQGFGSTAVGVLENVAEVILKTVIKRILDASGLIDKLMDGITKVLGKIGIDGLSGAAGKAASTAAAAGTAASGTASGAASSSTAGAASGLTNALGIASLGVGVASGITQGIQMAQLLTDTGRIEESARYSKGYLLGLNAIELQYLPELKHLTDIWSALVNGPLGEVRDILRYGVLHVTTDSTDALINQIQKGTGTPQGGYLPGQGPLPDGSADVPQMIANSRNLSRGFGDLLDKTVELTKAFPKLAADGGYQLKPGESFAPSPVSPPLPQTLSQIYAQFQRELGLSVAEVNANISATIKEGIQRGWVAEGTTIQEYLLGGGSKTSATSTSALSGLTIKDGVFKLDDSALTQYRLGNIDKATYEAADKARVTAEQLSYFTNSSGLVATLRQTGQTDQAILAFLNQFPRGTDFANAAIGKPGVAAGYQGGGKAATDYSGISQGYALQQQGIQQAIAELLGGPAVDRVGYAKQGVALPNAGSAVPLISQLTDSQINTATQQFATQFQAMQAASDQQTSAAISQQAAWAQSTALAESLFRAGNSAETVVKYFQVQLASLEEQYVKGQLTRDQYGIAATNLQAGLFTAKHALGPISTTGPLGTTTVNYDSGIRAYAAAPLDYNQMLRSSVEGLRTPVIAPATNPFGGSGGNSSPAQGRADNININVLGLRDFGIKLR